MTGILTGLRALTLSVIIIIIITLFRQTVSSL